MSEPYGPLGSWQLVKGVVLPAEMKPKPGQEIVICTADNRLRIEAKVMYIAETHGGVYVRMTDGKLRYYSKAQLVYYEWTAER